MAKGKVSNPATDGRCKLNWFQVEFIRTSNQLFGVAIKHIATAVPVTERNVRYVINHDTWKVAE